MTWRVNASCSKGRFVDTWMLATCRPVEILCWDRGDDRRAELLECYGEMTLPDMCDKDVVIINLLKMTNTVTASQCRALWMRCLERSELVKLGCVLETSEASWAFAPLNSGFNARWSV